MSSSTVADSAKIVKTSTSQVLAAVTASTNQAAFVMLKPFAQNIANAVRNAILGIASSSERTVGKVLAKLVPVLMGFLSHLLGLGGLSDFARGVLGRLT